jgi:hypothetical protein
LCSSWVAAATTSSGRIPTAIALGDAVDTAHVVEDGAIDVADARFDDIEMKVW